MRRRPRSPRRYVWRVDTWVSQHNQQPGYVVRRVFTHNGEKIMDHSKYFSESRYGSMSTACWHALRYKNSVVAHLARPTGRRFR